MLGRKLSEFFPSQLKERFKEIPKKKPKRDDRNRKILRDCALKILGRPDKGWGQKRPRKLRVRLGPSEKMRLVKYNRELGELALQELLRPFE